MISCIRPKDGVERIFFLVGIVIEQNTKRQQIRNYMKSVMVNCKWLPDFIERLKASAWHQLYLPLPLLPFTHARSESINADSLKLQLLTARKKEWWPATANSLPHAVYLTTVKHTALVGIEPTTFRSWVRRATSCATETTMKSVVYLRRGKSVFCSILEIVILFYGKDEMWRHTWHFSTRNNVSVELPSIILCISNMYTT